MHSDVCGMYALHERARRRAVPPAPRSRSLCHGVGGIFAAGTIIMSISVTFEYDNGEDVCTVNQEGAANGSYMVSTFSVPDSVLKPNGDQAIYTCPGGSNGAYAQCDGGICFKSTQGQSFPGFDEPLAKDEIIWTNSLASYISGRSRGKWCSDWRPVRRVTDQRRSRSGCSTGQRRSPNLRLPK
jgi:hypothetical protein